MLTSVDGRWPQCNLAKGNDLATTTIPDCFAEPNPREEGAERFTCGIECPDAYSDSVVVKVREYKVKKRSKALSSRHRRITTARAGTNTTRRRSMWREGTGIGSSGSPSVVRSESFPHSIVFVIFPFSFQARNQPQRLVQVRLGSLSHDSLEKRRSSSVTVKAIYKRESL